MGWVMASNICKWHTKSPILVKGNLTIFGPVIYIKVSVTLSHRNKAHQCKTLTIHLFILNDFITREIIYFFILLKKNLFQYVTNHLNNCFRLYVCLSFHSFVHNSHFRISKSCIFMTKRD